VLAQELVASGQDHSLPEAQRVFAYMPYKQQALVVASLLGQCQ
jgi:uncharacterized protein (DUF924 family)